MSLEKVKELLQELQEELKNTSEVDEQTQQQIDEIDDNIHQMLNADNFHERDIYDAIIDKEYEFVAEHPIASGIIRQIVDILSKAGI
jgi:DNA-binding transcriptional MerR regulator